MKVLKVSKSIQTYKGPKYDMRYFNIVAANMDEVLHIRCYQTGKFTMITPGRTLKFIDMVKKGESCWVVASSKVAFAPSITTGTFGDVVLPEEQPAAGCKRKLGDAIKTPEKSAVAGKIIQVSPLSFRMEGTLPVRCIAIKDDTATVKVALFDKLATSTHEEGSSVEVSSVYKKTFNNREQLTTTRESSCQFIQSTELSDIEVTRGDLDTFKEDPDFNVWATEGIEMDLEVDCIYESYTYRCCSQMSCRQKKMVEGVCPTCRGSASCWTYRAVVNITLPDNEQKSMTLFSKDLNCLFGIVNDLSDDELIDHLVSQLPKKFKGLHGLFEGYYSIPFYEEVHPLINLSER